MDRRYELTWTDGTNDQRTVTGPARLPGRVTHPEAIRSIVGQSSIRPRPSPLRATPEELAGLPETFLVVDEYDVLRDEGEAFGRRLIEAGVPTTTVRYNATVHDFMMLNPLRGTAATTGAIEQAVHILRKALATG